MLRPGECSGRGNAPAGGMLRPGERSGRGNAPAGVRSGGLRVALEPGVNYNELYQQAGSDEKRRDE